MIKKTKKTMIEQEITKELTEDKIKESRDKKVEDKLLQLFDIVHLIKSNRWTIGVEASERSFLALCDYIGLIFREEYGKLLSDKEILEIVKTWVK